MRQVLKYDLITQNTTELLTQPKQNGKGYLIVSKALVNVFLKFERIDI